MERNQGNVTFKVNNNIRTLDIPYIWEELSCRSRPIATSFYAINEHFLDLYLFWESFSKIYLLGMYFYDLEVKDLDHIYIDFYNKNLSEIFGIVLQLEQANNEEHFHESIMQNVINNNAVLIPVDLYMMPYAPYYKNESHSHFILIKGYDLDRRLYYVLDNMQLEEGSTKHENFKILFDDIYKMHMCYCENHLKHQKNPYILVKKISDTQDYYSKSIRLFQKILSTEQSKLTENCIEMNLNASMGEHRLDKSYFYSAMLVINMRTVYYNTLSNILKNVNIASESLNEFNINISMIQKKWTGIKSRMIHSFVKDHDLEKISKMISDNIKKEFDLLNDVLQKVEIQGENDKNFHSILMLNNNDALYKYNSEKIEVIHSNNKRYDTWLMQDNAFQLLIPVKNEKELLCQVNIRTEKEILPYHFGIVIRCSDNTKILYGKEAVMVSVYHPLSEENFEIGTIKYVEQSVNLKIEKTDDELKFYIRAEKNESWQFLFTYDNNRDVTHIGIFSKTTDFINHAVSFEDFKLELQSEAITIESLSEFLEESKMRQ